MSKKVKKMSKILIERLLNTRFKGKIGAIKIKENPNVWSNQKMYSEQEIPGPANPYKTGVITGASEPYTFTVDWANWRTGEFTGRYLGTEIPIGSGVYKFFPIRSNTRTTLTVNEASDGTVPADSTSWKILTTEVASDPPNQTASDKLKKWLYQEDDTCIYHTDENDLEALTQEEGEFNSLIAGRKDHAGIPYPAGNLKKQRKVERFARRVFEGLAPIDSGKNNLELFDEDSVIREVMSEKFKVFDGKARVEALMGFSDWAQKGGIPPGDYPLVDWAELNHFIYVYINSIDLDNPDNHEFY